MAITDDVVASYPFNGDANDATSNGHDGIVQGDPVLTEDRAGNPNSAYAFDGVDDEIYLPWSMVVPAWNAYSISIWYKSNLQNSGEGNLIYGSEKYHDEEVVYSNQFSLGLTDNYYLSFSQSESTQGLADEAY